MRSSEPTMPRETVLENLLGAQRFRDEMAEDNAERLLRLKRKLPAALSKLPEKQRMYLLAYYGDEAQNLVSLCRNCHQKRHKEMKGE